MTTVPVPLPGRAYDVRIGRFDSPAHVAGEIAAAVGSPSGVAVLVDGNVGARSPRVEPLVTALAARLPNVRRYDLSGGEACKNLGEIQRTTEWLAGQGFDRGATVIGVGGGAAGDHAGFAAAIYLRGIRFALCPTTLLAMVDASVGGKTAVDLGAGKNLVGAFHQPCAVVADLGFLETLPARERIAGLAEVVKTGLIADAALLETLEADADALASGAIDAGLEQVIAAAVRVKASVVTEDERESGRRAILNFGHTVGHALEAASGYELLHGEAVSLGMVAALSLGVSLGLTPPAVRDRIHTLLRRLGLPVDVDRRLTPEVLARIDVDKKRRSDAVRFVFVTAAGTTHLQDVPLSGIARASVGVINVRLASRSGHREATVRARAAVGGRLLSLGSSHDGLDGRDPGRDAPSWRGRSRWSLLLDVIGGWRQTRDRLVQLMGLLVTFVRPGLVRARLERLRALGHIEVVPTTAQILVAARDQMFLGAVKETEMFYRAQKIPWVFHNLRRFLSNPATVLDPAGLFSPRDTIIHHVLQTFHRHPVYDLVLLRGFDGGVEEMQRQAAQIVAGTHPHQRALASLIEDGGYHARLVRQIQQFRADPFVAAEPIPRGLVDDPNLMLAMDQFKDLRGFTNYAARLPVGSAAAVGAWLGVAWNSTLGALLHVRCGPTGVRVDCCDPTRSTSKNRPTSNLNEPRSMSSIVWPSRQMSSRRCSRVETKSASARAFPACPGPRGSRPGLGLLDDGDGGADLAPLALVEHAGDHLPEVRLGLVVLAPLAAHPDPVHDAPAPQRRQRHGRAAGRYVQSPLDVRLRQRFGR